MPPRCRPVLVLLALAFPSPAFAQAPPDKAESVRATYTKFEFKVPMRDGVKLHTAVYVPKDDSKPHPFLITRTPYSCAPYGVDKYPESLRPGPQFMKAGYIFVIQDVRGRWMSEGEFVNMRPHNPAKKGKEFDEASDTFDTIEWLLKNVPNNNGKAGITGISYPGFYTAAGMIDAHPALKAASPQAPITDWFVGDDFHHNGCLFLPHGFNFLANFGHPRPAPTSKSPFPRFDHETPDGYKFFLDMGPLKNADAKYFKGNIAFWNEMMAHGTYDDFWKSRNLRPHIKNIKPAVLTVGGWFDAENLFGALETFKATEANAPPSHNTLVMGPWVHGGWNRGAGDKLGDVTFGANTGDLYRTQIELPFFEYHLKGKGAAEHPKAWVFETGTNRWRKFDAWPPKEAKATAFHFQKNGGLGGMDDGTTSTIDFKPWDEFVSDPAKPVPFINKIGIGMFREYMTADQRFASQRPDVLVYQTPVLTEDTTIGGPIEVELHVSTTGTDADWVVKLIDVYPDDYPDADASPEATAVATPNRPPVADVRMGGYQQLVRGEPFRGKFRSGFDKPEAFKPGEVAKVKFTMPDTLHTFRPGHRIMVQVQSTWFPLVDRNPQTFCDINKADEKDFVKQTHRVHRSADAPSKVTLRVVK